MSNHGPAECLQQYIGCECILFCNVERPTAPPRSRNMRKKVVSSRSIETYDTQLRSSNCRILEFSFTYGSVSILP